MRGRRGALTSAQRHTLAPGRGESVLATATDRHTGDLVCATTWRLVVVAPEGDGLGGVVLDRPWHEVDAGVWDPETTSLSVSFVNGGRAHQWQLGQQPGQLPAALRDRVSASVVLSRVIDVGPRRTARVVIRTVLQTRELVEQVLLGRGARDDDSELVAAVARARDDLRGQVGLPAG